MANICSNYITVVGPQAKEATDSIEKHWTYGTPERIDETTLSAESGWSPPDELILEAIKDYPGVEVTDEYSECGNDVYGTATYSDGVCNDVTVSHKGSITYEELEFLYLLASKAGRLRVTELVTIVEDMEERCVDFDSEVPDWDRIQQAAVLVMKGELSADTSSFMDDLYRLLSITEYADSNQAGIIGSSIVPDRKYAEDHLASFIEQHDEDLSEVFRKFTNG